MSQSTTKHLRPLGCKKGINALLIISLIFTILFGACTCFYYYEASQWLSLFVRGPLIIIMALAPLGLFALYISQFYHKWNGVNFVPLVFGIIAAAKLCFLIASVLSKSTMPIIYAPNFLNLPNLLFALFYTVAFTLLVIDVLNGIFKKLFLIIVVGAAIVSKFSVAAHIIDNMDLLINKHTVMYVAANLLYSAAYIFLCVALFVFAFKNSSFENKKNVKPTAKRAKRRSATRYKHQR